MFVLRSRLRYFSGKAMTAMASSNPASMQATALGAHVIEEVPNLVERVLQADGAVNVEVLDERF
jgi:hypothetical protein